MGLMYEIMTGPYSPRAIAEADKAMSEGMAREYSKQWISAKMNGKHRNIKSKRNKKR